MISYVDEIEALFDLYEEQRLTEKDIFERCIELVIKHEFNKDYMYDLNDTLYNRGYSFQFDVNRNKVKFDVEEYGLLITNVSKSKDKTKSLIEYLDKINDQRLTLASIHMLKVKHLIELGYLPNDNNVINDNNKLSLKDLFFIYYSNKEIHDIVIEALSRIGIEYAMLEYFDFIFDIEYLLWSIEEKDKNYGYLKSNTLKVALNIAPKEYFEKDGKQYYNPKFSKVTKEYIKLIDKVKINQIKDKWGPEGYETIQTGHRLLYKLL